MIPVLVALAGGVLSALAFPRFGPGVLIVPGIALFLLALRRTGGRAHGVLIGFVYGISYFTGLMWWSIELGLVALVPLVLVQAIFPAAFGWWIAGRRDAITQEWFLVAVGGWAVVELVRYHFPFSGLEWGAAGYALSGSDPVRLGAGLVGTSGWTVLVVALAAGLALLADGQRSRWLLAVFAAPLVVIGLGAIPGTVSSDDVPDPATVAIVQGSTPCPYEKCPPNERLRTFELHLDLTRSMTPGDADLVVWAEGSTGSSNADPVRNPEIGEAIAGEAERLGAWFLVGSDRPVNEEEWVNANVVYDEDGQFVGEYRKQQGVPFGEYIPFRPLFEWIPELSQVPRDMIPGDGAVVFPMDERVMGSVISFEGSFSRYTRQHVLAGANFLVIATNEGSYGTTPASDQLIAMTRMRAAELGVPVVHAAVTGKSVVMDRNGDFVSGFTGLGTSEIVFGPIGASQSTIYRSLGDWVMYLAAVIVSIWAVFARRRSRLASATSPVNS